MEALSPELVAGLLADAALLTCPPGSFLFDTSDPSTRVGLLLSGTARSFLRATDGRQLTIRYPRRGAIVGKRFDPCGDHAPVSVQAVTSCTVLELDAEELRRLVETDVTIGRVFVSELAGRLMDMYAAVADVAFGSMRQRIVRHLLAMADDGTEERRLVRVTQQQLADGVGTKREVVARMLAALRAEGLISTAPREIEILDLPLLATFVGEWRGQRRPRQRDPFLVADGLAEAEADRTPVLA